MTLMDLKLHLGKLGKRAFVTHFHDLVDLSRPGMDIARELTDKEGWTETAAQARVTCARRMLREGLVGEALTMCAEAPRVPKEVRAKARELAAGWGGG